MSDGVKVTVRRKDQLFKKLRALAPAAEKALVEANGQAAAEMVSIARSYVPVRTGRLRDSIVATAPGGSPPSHGQGITIVPEGAWAVTAGNGKVRYPHLVEFGSKPHLAGGQFEGASHPGAPAQPFFFPAYRLIRKKQRSRASRALTKSIKEVTGK